MIRLVVGLAGLAVFGAIFAGIYYAYPDEKRTPFNLAPGEVESDQVQPADEGHPVEVSVEVLGPAIDVYVMEAEDARRLVDGKLRLDRPFTYRAEFSRLNVTGTMVVTLVSDGSTPMTVVLDNSDNYYDDTEPQGVASVRVVTRYPAEQERNLLFAYLAVLPSVLLVAVTLQRKAKRFRGRRQA